MHLELMVRGYTQSYGHFLQQCWDSETLLIYRAGCQRKMVILLVYHFRAYSLC